MVNSGVFQSLTQSLSRELDCARQIEKQMESLQEIESLQELRTAQSRIAALERTHQSALEAREDGHVMVTKMVEDACGDRVAALGREVAASRLQLQVRSRQLRSRSASPTRRWRPSGGCSSRR